MDADEHNEGELWCEIERLRDWQRRAVEILNQVYAPHGKVDEYRALLKEAGDGRR